MLTDCIEGRALRVLPSVDDAVREVGADDGIRGGPALELEHSTPAEVLDELVRTYGPGGTIGVGVGWDLTLIGLD